MFNRDSSQQKWGIYDKPLTVDAKIIDLHDGEIIGRLGIFSGRRMSLRDCALLKIGGVKFVIISERSQTADPVFLKCLIRI